MPLCQFSSRKISLVVAACALSYGLSGATASAAQEAASPAASVSSNSTVTSRIVDRIDESRLVTLKGTLHPLANASNDRGAAPESLQLNRMHLVLTRSAGQKSSLRQLIGDLHTPGTASYHKWLTPDQFGKQFGPSDQDITTVETWLTGHGFNVAKVNPGNQTIEFSGNVAQLRSAFHTQIHKYEVNGENHYANANDPQIPAALAPVVGGFVSLNNFHLKDYSRLLGKASYNPKTDKATPLWTQGPGSPAIDNNYVLAPQDYAVQYDLSPLYTAGTNGSGQTIAIINESNINIDLVNQFRSLFSLPVNPPQVIIDGNDPGVDGINNPDGPNYASVEAYLDVEWSGAVAPNATVDLVIAADTQLENGLTLAMEHAVYANVAPVISLSFGGCEMAQGTFNQFVSGLWEQAAAQGITVLVSTGDNGSAGCDDDNTQYYAVDGQAVNGLGSTPYNVAVGGTDFYYSSYNQGQAAIDAQLATYWSTTPSNNTPTVSIKGVIPEQPWNDSQYGLNLFSTDTLSGGTITTIAGGSGGASNCATGSGTGTNGGWATCTAGYPKPSWQAGTGVPSDGVRDLPDLSLFASNGSNDSFYPLCAQDGDCLTVPSGSVVQISGVGGTSASTPSFAGVMALVNQKYGRQGQAAFVLYPLAKQFPAAFHDVTNGTNSVPCAVGSTDCIAVANPATVTDPNLGTAKEGQIGTGTTAEYNATAGYDLATGLGTIDANQLVTNWGSVKFATTATTLTPSSTSFAHGTAITVSGTVTTASGTPTGDVALVTDSTEPGQQGKEFFTLSGGTYSGSVSTLPGGTYNIWGQYGGDPSNALSTSAPTQITVSPEASGIDFNLFGNNSHFTPGSGPGTSVDYGTQLVLSALIAPTSQLTALENCTINGGACPTFTSPTGTVTFTDGSTVLNNAVVNIDGDAEYNAPFPVGTHSVTASYSGDNSYSKSTASAIAFTVIKDTPQIGLSTSYLTSSQQAINGAGQPTVFTIQVANNVQYSSGLPVSIAAPTGTVTVTGLPSGVPTSATLTPAVTGGAVEGVATFTIPASTPGGPYSVTVSYSGDPNYNVASIKGTIAVVSPSGLASTTTATMSGSISPNSNIVITGTVTGQTGKAAPTGVVYIYSSGNFINEIGLSAGTGDVANFSTVLNSQSLSQGANFITLQYSGDTTYAQSAFNLNSGNPIANPLSDFTLVPQTTIVPVTAGSSGTDTINLASVNGFSGNVSFTCKAAPGITCAITPTGALSSGGSTTATLTISAQADTANISYNVLITGTDPTGAFIHTLGVQAVVTGSSVGSESFFLSNSGNLNLDAGATTGNTATITVNPLGGFTGTVGLSCAVTGPSGATSPATCSLASASVAAGSGTDVLMITTTATTTDGPYTVTVTGTSGTITITTAFTVNVSTPAFALTNSGRITVKAGATTGNTSTITVTPSQGFTGVITLSCAITPVAASDPAACSLPASVTITGATAQTATLTVTTTTATTALNKPANLLWPSAGGAVLAMVFFFGIPARRRNWLSMLGLLLLFVSVSAVGCGGGSGSSSGGGGGTSNPGTTAGTYTVTVTATPATGPAETTTVTLTVQ